MKKFFYALGIGCMLSACSSNEELAPEDKGELGGNANYLSIAIVTAGEDGTRADDEYGKENLYDAGTETERGVNKVRLYFFDVEGNRVYSRDFEGDELKNKVDINASNGYNPATSTLTTIEVELTANRDYHSVVAILNPPSTAPVFEKLSQLRSHTADYGTLAQGGTFTMSNSVYYDTNKYSDAITTDKDPVVAVPIYSSNIYTHDDPDVGVGKTYATLDDLRAAKAIQIYVERACSKLTVTNQPDLTAHFIGKNEDGTKTSKIKVIGDDGKEKEIEVKVEFRGMALTVLPKDARVIKKLNTTPVEGQTSLYYICQHVPNFQWNNPSNFRTHWEAAGFEDKEKYTYTSTWQNLADNVNNLASSNPIVKYINPNTQDATNHAKDDKDFTTKLLVCAQLYFEEGEVKKELDLVRYSGGLWLPSRLITMAATRVAENLDKLDLTTVTVKIDDQTLTLTEAEQTKAQGVIKKIKDDPTILTKIEAGKDRGAIFLQKLGNADHDYLAELTLKEKKDIDPLLGLTGSDASTTKVSTAIRENMQATLLDMTKREIQYWKKGMTYFYVPIRHVGFPGLYGDIKVDGVDTPNYLNGVVRNHSYSVTIDGIYGLGTPVIDPNKPIDPERPSTAPASYITAKIHVLKWKLVNNNAVLH